MKKKRLFLIFGVIVILIIYFVFSLFNSKRQKSPNPSNNSVVQPPTTVTPTSFKQDVSEIIISSSSPTQNEEFVITSSKIVLNFKSDISQDKKSLLSVIVSPEFEFDYNWSDNKTLIISPKKELSVNKTYNLTLSLYDRKIYNLSFTTTSYTSKEVNDQIQQQIDDDLKFTESVYKYKQQNPWFSKLPIIENDYLIVYDGINKKIVIAIDDKIAQSNRQSVINKAIESIKSIHPNIKEDEYYIFEK